MLIKKMNIKVLLTLAQYNRTKERLLNIIKLIICIRYETNIGVGQVFEASIIVTPTLILTTKSNTIR